MFRGRQLIKYIKRNNKFRKLSNCNASKDEFEEYFLKNHLQLSQFQKIMLLVGSPVHLLITDHKRVDLLACLAELTSSELLATILKDMWMDYEGQQILAERPLINIKTLNMTFLKSLPANTFGREYVEFLSKYDLSPDNGVDVKFMDDQEVAYLMTRFRHCHDFVHCVMNMPPNKLGETCIKWIEAFSIGSPFCYAAAILAPLLMNQKQRDLYKKYYLPWAIENGVRLSVPPIFIYWEKRWEQNITDLRNELGIVPFDKSILSRS